MSVVVARDQSTASHIVFPWPDPVPWGAELVCSDSEVAVICPNWEVGEQFGPGRHSITPPNPQSHVLAYFISTRPQLVRFDRLIAVIDGGSGQPVGIRFYGAARIKIGDPILLCHQLVGLPYYDLTTGIMRSAELSICRTIQNVIAKICMAHGTVRAIANSDAAAQIVNMASNSNPLAVAVTGLEFVRFDEFGLSIHGGEPIAWKGSMGDGSGASAGDDSMDSDLDADTHADPQAALRSSQPVIPVSQQTGPQPPVPSVGRQTGPQASMPGGPVGLGGPGGPGVGGVGGVPGVPGVPGGQQTGSHPPALPGGMPASRSSSPHLSMSSGVVGGGGVRRKTPALGMPAVPSPSGEAPLPSGTQVLVYWNDGLWHQAVIRHFEGGRYQVAIDGSDTLAWVQATQIRPG